MDKNGVVSFGKWNEGQVKHPVYGFGLLQNVEVFENPGIAKIKNRFTARAGITPDQLPIAEVKDQYGNVYTMTGHSGQGIVYKNGVAIQSALPNPWDLAIYKDYLWVRQSTSLHAYGPLSSGSAQWFSSVGSGFSTVYNGKLCVGQDDFLYSGNGNYVAKIEVLTSGTPAVAPTITLTLDALDLPDGQYVTTLVEYGKNLMIGTQGGSSYADRGNFPTARIYPWNRQAGTLGNPGLADLPVVFSENGINALLNHANRLYVQAGTQGNIYVTDSTSFAFVGQLPYAPTGVLSQSTVFTNAMAISAQGTLLVGLSTYGDTYGRAGVYEINIKDPKYPIAYQTISTKDVGLSSVTKIGFIRPSDYQVLNIGWSQGSTYGIDASDYVLFSSYGAVIETELVQVGKYNQKKTFEHLEWCLADPMVNGQKIRISYRKNGKDAYSTPQEWTFGQFTEGLISFEDTYAIADAEYLQLKIELDQATSTLYGSNILLLGVRVW